MENHFTNISLLQSRQAMAMVSFFFFFKNWGTQISAILGPMAGSGPTVLYLGALREPGRWVVVLFQRSPARLAQWQC